jgi:hypothetical protein
MTRPKNPRLTQWYYRLPGNADVKKIQNSFPVSLVEVQRYLVQQFGGKRSDYQIWSKFDKIPEPLVVKPSEFKDVWLNTTATEIQLLGKSGNGCEKPKILKIFSLDERIEAESILESIKDGKNHDFVLKAIGATMKKNAGLDYQAELVTKLSRLSGAADSLMINAVGIAELIASSSETLPAEFHKFGITTVADLQKFFEQLAQQADTGRAVAQAVMRNLSR